MSELSDIAASLREHADSLDRVAASVAAGDTIAQDAEKLVQDTAPAGVSAVGWEAFLRGDNPASLSDEDQAGLVAAGKLPDPNPAPAPVNVTVSTADTPPANANPGAEAPSPSEPVSAPEAPGTGESTPEPAGAPEPAGEPVQAGDSAESAATVSGASVPAETEGAPAESVPADESA